jgi:hypothetical protein
MIDMKKKKIRVIAFYLPQFHPIPENDAWWGEGFTEWTNVRKAKPLFSGHYQPRIPADLGYYDLRMPEVRAAQAEMAREAGVEGFCYYHYWFAGKRLLERPFNEVLKSGKPDFPFCLCWANETWSGIWHGAPNRILIEQTYPGIEDYTKHFYANLDAFLDGRYIKVAGKPLFYVYAPFNIPDTRTFFDLWKELALKNGLKGIHFVGLSFDAKQAKQVLALGYDAVNTNWLKGVLFRVSPFKTALNKLYNIIFKDQYNQPVWDFIKLAGKLSNKYDTLYNSYPTILSGWDNSPRSGNRGRIFTNYSPEIFDVHIKNVLEKTKNKTYDTNIVFLKSWNEWAEGNYVEPDLKYGWDFLNVLKNNILDKNEN